MNRRTRAAVPRTNTAAYARGASASKRSQSRGAPSPRDFDQFPTPEEKAPSQRLNLSQLSADIQNVASGVGRQYEYQGDQTMPLGGLNSSRADRLAELASSTQDAPSTLSTWNNQAMSLGRSNMNLEGQRNQTSEQLKQMLEENLRLKMSSETLKDELEQKRVELTSREHEAGERKNQVDELSSRANMLDAQYREKMHELRRFTDMTQDLEKGITATDDELSRAEGDLEVKNEVAVRMKSKIDELLVEIERVNALTDDKNRQLEGAKSNAIALGSKHEALEAEFQIRAAEAGKWKDEETKLNSENQRLERELKDATAAIQAATKEVAHLTESANENETSLRQLNSEKSRLQRGVDSAQSRFNESSEDKFGAASQVKSLSGELDGWQGKIEDLETEVNQQSELVRDLESEADQCSEMEAKYRAEIEDLRSTVAGKQETAANARRSYQEMRETLDQDQASLKRMEREIIESTEEIARLRDRSDSIKKDRVGLETEHRAALDAFAKAEAEERTAKEAYDQVKGDVDKSRSDLGLLETDNDRMAKLLTELRSEIADLGADHSEAMESAQEYRAKVDRLKGVLTAKRETSEKLRSQLETEEVSKLEEQINEQNYLVKAQQDALDARNRMVDRLRTEENDLDNELLKCRQQFEERQQEIAVLSQTLEDKEKEAAVLKNEADKYTEEFTRHDVEMKKARIATKIKEESVKGLKKRANELGEQLDSLEDMMKTVDEEALSGHQLVKTLEAELAWGLEEFEAKREQADRYRAKAQGLVSEIAEKREWCGEVTREKERWAQETEILGKIVSEVDYELIRRQIEKEAADKGGDTAAMLNAANAVKKPMQDEAGTFKEHAGKERDAISDVLTDCKTLSTELVYREMDLQHAVLESERWRKRKEDLEQRVAATGKDLATNVEMVQMRKADANALLEEIRKSEHGKRLAEENLLVYEAATQAMEDEVRALRTQVDNRREELAELGINDTTRSPFDVATSEPLRLRNELMWLDDRVSKRKMQSAQAERNNIIQGEQLEAIQRDYEGLENSLKKQVNETEKYKQMVADMVGYTSGAAGEVKGEVPSDLLNDPLVLRYKADTERLRDQIKRADVDVEAQRAELAKWKEMSDELNTQVSSRAEELRRVNMDLKVKKEVGMRLQGKSVKLAEDLSSSKAALEAMQQ